MAAFSPKANPAEPTKKASREVFKNVSVCSSLFALLVAVKLEGFSAGAEGSAARGYNAPVCAAACTAPGTACHPLV